MGYKRPHIQSATAGGFSERRLTRSRRGTGVGCGTWYKSGAPPSSVRYGEAARTWTNKQSDDEHGYYHCVFQTREQQGRFAAEATGSEWGRQQ